MKLENIQIPTDCAIKDFYIGSDNGSGIKANSLRDFLLYIIDEVIVAANAGCTTFDIKLENNN